MKKKEFFSNLNLMVRSLGLSTLFIFFIFLLDFFIKSLVINSMDLFQVIYINEYFDFVRIHNTGAAFSFLSTASGWQRWFFIIIGLVAITWFYTLLIAAIKEKSKILNVAMVLILGGAVGNTFDRLYYGYVIDYLSFHINDWYYPAFNLADTCLSIGAFFFLISLGIDYFRKNY